MDTLTKLYSPTMVITANGEVQTHEEATVYVKEMFFLDSEASLRCTRSSVTWKTLRKIIGILTICGPVVKNHISSKMNGISIATQRTPHLSLSLVYRQVLPNRSESLSLGVQGNFFHEPAETQNPHPENDDAECLQDVSNWLHVNLIWIFGFC